MAEGAILKNASRWNDPAGYIKKQEQLYSKMDCEEHSTNEEQEDAIRFEMKKELAGLHAVGTLGRHRLI
jgi:hypothetical protein